MVYFIVFGDNTITMKYYIGAVNTIHVCVLFFLGTFYTLLRLWGICFRKSRNFCVAVNVIIICIIAVFFYFSRVIDGCDYWPHGINGSIDNSDPTMCKIPTPNFCWYKITNGFQDASLLLRKNCRDFPQSSEEYNKKFNKYFRLQIKDSPFIGLPNINNASERDRMDKYIQKTVFSQSKGYLSLEEAKKANHDIVFERESLKYHIQVLFNETLAQER